MFDRLQSNIASMLSWIIVHLLYLIKKSGLSNIPDSGAAILIANHVSYIDALIISCCTRRPVRFMMYWKIYNIPIMKWFFKSLGAIPIASKKENESLYNRAFEKVEYYLSRGDLVCIFPEGELTKTGEMNEFKPGIKKILSINPVPVIPIGLGGLWGIFFSLKYGKSFIKIPRRLWSRITINIGEPMLPTSTIFDMQEKVASLRSKP